MGRMRDLRMMARSMSRNQLKYTSRENAHIEKECGKPEITHIIDNRSFGTFAEQTEKEFG